MSKIRKLQRRKSNPNLVTLIDVLLSESAKNEAPVWKEVAERLAKPRRLQAEVNVSKIEKYAKPNEYVVVPGKVLGSGSITKPVKVAALSFSEKAASKIREAGGVCMKIEELLKENPKGSGVRLMV
ncbi:MULTISPECIES: 50S ribosomal protein L18e [Archaeoglobus]|jgi:large subunit ribosomal protein L18e|uniref:Large ribosomal subunit protein eL18 n=2 Tax=Archaeoglobus fulgidus TaxID=2234 RepID=A0A075WKA4_ARCFL|nr:MULTISPECIES: 50S ribosomal protein L18e [Archaeoglobus]AIG98003.1 Ribosomal protein L18E [Archaeoglobus fulgidus DSM 8774]KUJ94098.1 MAG: 50S ribosomal protein L18e [Archaeoglobus fulgidus]KUK07688.1 MAG: 50S ribosomal protein L18e [Archaeoglobus fulgidus]MDI3497384.1 large subunit ribosomal protein L18e [Archaeoglobus sp.]